MNAHLFGMPQAAGELDPTRAPTQMSWCWGTIAQTDPDKGLAIIGERGQSAQGLRGGQDHHGRHALHSVYPTA